MKKYTKYLFFIALVSTTLHTSANVIGNRIDSLWHIYNTGGDAYKVNTLLCIAGDYEILNSSKKQDSAFNIAITIAQLTTNDTLQMRVYEDYIQSDDLADNSKSLNYANQMVSLAKNTNNKEWFCRAYQSLASASLNAGAYASATDEANKANEYANLLSNNKLKVRCYLLVGNCAEKRNNKIDAFRNYMNALYLSEKDNDTMSVYDTYDCLYSFFMVLSNYDKARQYKLKQLQLITSDIASDSIRLMNLNNDMALLSYDNNNRTLGEYFTNTVINFATQHGYIQLKYNALAIFRTYLINNGLFNDLANLYIVQYPGEFAIIQATDTILFYRLKAYIQEGKKSPDSAAIYYQLAADRITTESHDGIFLSNFFKRYGEFLLRNGNVSDAKIKFDAAYKYALSAKYFPYVLDATKYLDSISFMEKDFTKAYTYEKLNRLYADSLAMSSKQDELLLIEIDHENQNRALVAEKEHEKTERRHNLEDTAIVIVIASLFIILAMLGSFKVPKVIIKVLGFFSFILFFEFIIMITDTKVENYTHGEPWKILAFKLIIISIIAPIHHWLEHKVINYLYEHRLIDTYNLRVRPVLNKIRKKKANAAVVRNNEAGHN